MHLDVLACSLMYLDASGCLGCLDEPTHFYGWLMLKMTLDAAGCLGCLLMPPRTLDAAGCL